MTKLLRSLFKRPAPNGDDFSDFFEKSSGERVKVMREVLREASAEQRQMVGKYTKA